MARALGFDELSAIWAQSLDDVGKPPYEVLLPSPGEAAVILERLGVAAADAAEVIDSLPSPGRTPEWWWLLERSCHRLTRDMADPDESHFGWPFWVGGASAYSLQQRCFMPHVFLAAMPHAMAWHRSRSIAEGVSLASFSDLGRHMAIHRRMHGATGVDAPWWLSLCLRAEVFELGRLQFNWFHFGVGDESPLWYTEEEANRRGSGFRQGDIGVGIHIPESGPMTPAACDDSFEKAGRFFAEHLPLSSGQSRRLATCWSWLLDGQLVDYLPAESNIVRFQRRFEIVPSYVETDASMLEFVFRVPDPLERLDSLPQRTTLERAAVAHLKAGGHWRACSGWFEL